MKKYFVKIAFVGLALFFSKFLFAQELLGQKESFNMAGVGAAVSDDIAIDAAHLKLLKFSIDSVLKKQNAKDAFYMLVKGEKVLLKEFKGTVFGDSAVVPVGKTSRVFLSLAIAAMESRSLINPNYPAESLNPLFRVADLKLSKKITLAELAQMRGGVSSDAEKLLPRDAEPQEVFDAIFNASIASQGPVGVRVESALSTSAAAYIAASRFDADSKDLLASYKNILRKFVFSPLEMADASVAGEKFIVSVGGKYSLIPDMGLALSPDDIAKWLGFEITLGRTSSNVQLIDPTIMRGRSERIGREKFSPAFAIMNIAGVDFCATGDSIGGVSHIILINLQTSAAFAVFVKSQDPSVCMGVSVEFAGMLADLQRRKYTQSLNESAD